MRNWKGNKFLLNLLYLPRSQANYEELKVLELSRMNTWNFRSQANYEELKGLWWIWRSLRFCAGSQANYEELKGKDGKTVMKNIIAFPG